MTLCRNVVQLAKSSCRSKDHLHAQLNVSWSSDGSIPHTKLGARNVVIKGQCSGAELLTNKVMPVPHVEELTAEFYRDPFTDLGILAQSKILILISKPSNIRNTWSLAQIEVESVWRFERCGAQQRRVR